MAGAGSAVLVVSSQEYLDGPGPGGAAPAWVSDGFAAAGWTARGASAAEVAVDFVDGRGRAANGSDLPQIEGVPAAATLPVAATVNVPLQILRFERGSTSCSVEVAGIGSPLARSWAAQVMQQGAMRRIRDVGVGQADEKGATLAVGDVLLRAELWEEGVAGSTSRNASTYRALTGELLDALAAAHGR